MVRTDNAWEDWLIYLLEGVEATSLQTIGLIGGIKSLMLDFKHQIRDQLPRVYSQDLINNLFNHPYTKIEFLMDELQVHRSTASRYLDSIVEIGLLTKHRLGKDNYYLNDALFDLLANVNELYGAHRLDEELVTL